MAYEWLPVVTAPTGALLGAVAAYRLTRPQLSYSVDRVSMSASRVASTLPVTLDAKLAELVRLFPIGLSKISSNTAPERVYVEYLEILRQEIDDEYTNIDEAKEVANKLRDLVSKEDFDQVAQLYPIHHSRLWTWAEGEHRRGHSVFSDSAQSLAMETSGIVHEMHFLETDEFSAYQVLFKTTMLCSFHWRTKHVAITRIAALKEFAERVAVAVASHNRSDLLEYFGGLREVLSEAVRRLDEIRSQVLAQLDRYSRLQIEVLISNHGRSGTSVSPEIACQVRLKGYGVGGNQIDSNPILGLEAMSKAKTDSIIASVASEAVQDLRVDELTPIMIPAGETIRLVAASEHVLDSYADAIALKAAYSGAERTFQLTMTEFRQRLFSTKPTRKRRLRKVLFRDLAALRRATSAADRQIGS